MRSQDELGLRREHVGELEADRAAAGGQVDQRRVGEAHIDPASKRGDGRTARSIRPSSRMVSIFSRLLEYVTEPPGEVPDGAAGALDRHWNC